MKILVLNGVNLNMLGKRDPALYGTQTLRQLEKTVIAYGKKRGVKVICKHSDYEGTLVTLLHKSKVDGIVINAGAYSHYSYALRDAIECMSIPVVEVHLTDIYKRESFRHNDVLTDVVKTQIVGKGIDGYLEAIDCLVTK